MFSDVHVLKSVELFSQGPSGKKTTKQNKQTKNKRKQKKKQKNPATIDPL
jgi:hypothetical protein